MIASSVQQMAAQAALKQDLKPHRRSTSNATDAGSHGKVLWYPNNGTYRTPEGIQRMKDRRIAYRSRSHALSKLSNTQKRKLGIKL